MCDKEKKMEWKVKWSNPVYSAINLIDIFLMDRELGHENLSEFALIVRYIHLQPNSHVRFIWFGIFIAWLAALIYQVSGVMKQVKFIPLFRDCFGWKANCCIIKSTSLTCKVH